MKHSWMRFCFTVVSLNISISFCPAGIVHTRAAAPREEAAEEQTLYGEEEYNAYSNAAGEPDYERRGTLLIRFAQDFSKSALLPYVDSEYRSLLFACREEKNYELLESLAGRWLEIRSDSLQATAYAADAAKQLGKDKQYAGFLERIYGMQPTGDTAREIALVYKELGNHEKFIEWGQRVFSEHPEYHEDYLLRYELMLHYFESGDMDKAGECARLSLKYADLAASKDPAVLNQAGKVRQSCYDALGKIQYSDGAYSEAVKSFNQALEVQKYGEGYYFIGMCLWNLKRIDEGMIYLAAAELQGDGFSEKAGRNLERLYRSLHNNTTVGIQKIYKRARNLMQRDSSASLLLDN